MDTQQGPKTGQAQSSGSSTMDQARKEAEAQKERLNETVDRVKRDMNSAYQNFTGPNGPVTRSKDWVEENPGLALLIAAGAGALIGSLISAAARPAPPPTWSERLERTARDVASQARHYAGDAGEVLGDRVAEAATAVSKTARSVRHTASERGGDLAEIVGDAVADVVKAVLAVGVAKKVKNWID